MDAVLVAELNLLLARIVLFMALVMGARWLYERTTLR
jgi:hypothetical protein